MKLWLITAFFVAALARVPDYFGNNNVKWESVEVGKYLSRGQQFAQLVYPDSWFG